MSWNFDFVLILLAFYVRTLTLHSVEIQVEKEKGLLGYEADKSKKMSTKSSKDFSKTELCNCMK
jgi:hypothetical protein